VLSSSDARAYRRKLEATYGIINEKSLALLTQLGIGEPGAIIARNIAH